MLDSRARLGPFLMSYRLAAGEVAHFSCPVSFYKMLNEFCYVPLVECEPLVPNPLEGDTLPNARAQRYSTDNATPEDYYDRAYALEKITLAEIVKRELTPHL